MKRFLLSLFILAGLSVCISARNAQNTGDSKNIFTKTAVLKANENAQSLSHIASPAHLTTVAKKTIAVPQASDDVTASFSVRGADVESTVWSEDFEKSAVSPAGWNYDPTKNVTWTLKKAPSPSYDAAPNERALFVEGDYRVYNREISSATSAPVTVPAEGVLRAFIYYTINYDNYCRLIISASNDDFTADVTELWNSKDGQGERPAHWHAVMASLAKYAGQTIRLRFTYTWGSDDEIFKTGGYMGDFYIDGISITAPGVVEGVDVKTGETIDFVDTSVGDIVAWQWSFPGGTPATSTEKNPTVYYTRDGSYDVSLTVTDNDGHTSTATRNNFVNVTGVAPTAKIAISDGFRLLDSFNPMVAPLVPVTFTDASAGYPTDAEWSFTKYDDETGELLKSETAVGASVTKAFDYLHEWEVGLSVSNAYGVSNAEEKVSVEYDGLITNLRKGDIVTTFDLDGNGTFPGNNRMKMTMFAEKFSKPTKPIMIEGAYIFFATATAEQLADQVSNIGVHLCKSENGLPGERIDSFWWSIIDLDPSSDAAKGTPFPFTYFPFVDDEFFIVIDGFGDLYEDTDVSIYMADFRAEHNTTFMFKDGKWVDVSTYFPAGKNHTSLYVVPSVYHSVMASPTEEDPIVEFDEKGGSKEFELFSYLGYKTPVESADSWCRVTNEPNGYTLDTLVIECDALPAGLTQRETTVTPTDGYTTYPITVRQSAQNGVGSVTEVSRADIIAEGLTVRTLSGAEVSLYTTQGILVDKGAAVTAPAEGLYIAVSANTALKLHLK